jgi:hypothetical protein
MFKHKDEKMLGRKHIYLPHAQTAIYDSKVKLFLKRGISHQLGRDAVVRFECENLAIDVIKTNQASFLCGNCSRPGVSKWAGTRYFYPPKIVYSTGRNN